MTRSVHRIAALLALLVVVAAIPAHAAVEAQFDNDTNGLVPGPRATDRNYTLGTRTVWYGETGAMPRRAVSVAERFGVGRDARARVSFSLGQELYTPDAISKRTPILDDRPYAAWLYGGATLTSMNATRARSLDLRVGAIGPDARGEEVQTWWHRREHIRLPRGWRWQLANEVGARATLDQRWRPLGYRRFANVVPDAHVTLGNVLTEAGAGTTVALGARLPDDFGPGTPQGPEAHVRGARLYAFARGEGRAIARDLFLDGNTFVKSQRVHHLPFVAEAQLGLGVRLGALGVRYTFSHTTQQFRERNDYQEYGSIAVSF